MTPQEIALSLGWYSERHRNVFGKTVTHFHKDGFEISEELLVELINKSKGE